MVRDAVNRIVRRAARSPRLVRGAVLMRNQCDMTISYSLAPSNRPEANGEDWLLDRVAPHVDRFIDVGANVGNWTKGLLDRRPSAIGVAVEPGEAALAALRRRALAVTVVAAAAGEAHGGKVTFFEEPDAGEHSSVLATPHTASGKPREVPVVNVDGLVEEQGWDTVDLLKIDVEGYDAMVLRGASQVLQDKRVAIVQFEYNRPWIAAGATLAATTAWLQGLGYHVLVLRPGGVEPYDPSQFGEFFAYSNFVAVAAHAADWL